MAAEDEWDDVESGMDAELWSPLQGVARVGRYLRSEEVTVPDNKSPSGKRTTSVHFFRDPMQVTFKMWGSFDLDSRLNQVTAGSVVRITYEGQEDQGGGKTMNRYKVQVSKSGSMPGQTDDDIPF